MAPQSGHNGAREGFGVTTVALFPTPSTAAISAAADAVPTNVACPDSRSTEADDTPATAESASSTWLLQWLHVMPLISRTIIEAPSGSNALPVALTAEDSISVVATPFTVTVPP